MVVKIVYWHQEAKCVNVCLKVFYLFEFSHVWFFHSLLGCSWCTKCQKNKVCDFAGFHGQKTNMAKMVKLGYGCTNGFVAQKWSIFAERCILRKCRQLLGLICRSGDWLLWQPLLLVFCWLKVTMWYFVFLDQNVLCAAQQNCTKYQNF